MNTRKIAKEIYSHLSEDMRYMIYDAKADVVCWVEEKTDALCQEINNQL
jgi:hypothetical protein